MYRLMHVAIGVCVCVCVCLCVCQRGDRRGKLNQQGTRCAVWITRTSMDSYPNERSNQLSKLIPQWSVTCVVHPL